MEEIKTPRFTKVQEAEPPKEPQTFLELLMHEIYTTVMAKLDENDRRLLDEYECDFDYGTPTHAETKEQYDECVAEIMAEAAGYVLDMYVNHIKDASAEEA